VAEDLALAPSLPGLDGSAVELLSRLIRFDTVNPPGREQAAQEMLAAALGAAGFQCELLAAEPGRPNLVARLAGRAAGPTLCLLGHVDVVPFRAEDWSFEPLSGEVRDGEVLGRGAQDMKSQVAAEVAAAVALAESGWRPERGELKLIVTADEEMGAAAGARWLCEEHAELVACDWVLNEGAGLAVELGDRRLFSLCIGEKGVFRFHLRARGRAGHASQPNVGDNALLKLAPLLERLSSQPAPAPDADAARFVSVLLGEEIGVDTVAGAVPRVAELDPAIASWVVEPMLGVSVAPTRASASNKENVIPALAEVLVDCRVPPGMEEAEVRRTVEGLIGPGAYEVEFVDRVVGNRSDPEGELYDALAGWVDETVPGAKLAPMIMPGFSDSHWFRKELGAVAFGFFPQRAMTLGEAMPLVHGADERIKSADVALAANCYADVTRRLLG
jgi:acetylornithine deacetylase/succinyl-diaminopimelate desuccinylase-like protein